MCDRNMRRLYRLFVFTDAMSRQLRELNENRKCGPENVHDKRNNAQLAMLIRVLLHLRSFCKNFVCAYHTLARIKVVHLRSVLVLHLRLYFHSFSLASC